MRRFYEYPYIVTLGLAGIIFTAALPTSDYGVEQEQSDKRELETEIYSSDDLYGPRNTSSKNVRLEKLLSEIVEDTASEDIACEWPPPQYNQAGLLPHPRSCRKFYICDQQSRTVFTYKCPSSLVFNKEYGLCSIPLFDDAEENCLEEEPEVDLEISRTSKPMKRRSAISQDLNATVRCEDEANNITNAVEEVKNDTLSIDSYIIHIKSLSPIEIPLPSASLQGLGKNYKRVLHHYNADLENAQENTKLWKGESGAYETINHTLTEARNFGSEFQEGVKAFIQRIGLVKNGDGELRTATYESISDIKHRITELEEILTETPNGSDYDTVETLLEQEKQRLQTLENAYSIAEREYEFPEVINFLNFVMNNTVDVQKTVDKADKILYDFEQNVIEDLGKFQRHHTIAKEQILALEKENNENRILKASLPQEKQKLLQKKSSTETSLRDVRKRKAEVEEQLRQLRRRSKRSPLDPFTIILGLILGAVGTGIAIDDHNDREKKELEKQLRALIKRINSLCSNVKFLKNSIDKYDSKIDSLDKKSDILQKKITYFNELIPVFQDMENTVTPVITLIDKAKASVKSIGNLFLEVSVKLSIMTEDAIDAKDQLKSRNSKYFIYNEIDVMKCTWENVNVKLTYLEDL